MAELQVVSCAEVWLVADSETARLSHSARLSWLLQVPEVRGLAPFPAAACSSSGRTEPREFAWLGSAVVPQCDCECVRGTSEVALGTEEYRSRLKRPLEVRGGELRKNAT